MIKKNEKTCKKCSAHFTGRSCKPCTAAYMKNYKIMNKEKLDNRLADWRINNKKLIAIQVSNWRNNNLERYINWLDDTKERRIIYGIAYRSKNKERDSKAKAAWQRNNSELRKISRHKRRALQLNTKGSLSKGITEKLLALQRNRCACCKKSVKSGHHLDHIMPLKLGGSNTNDNIQILCPTCNLQKAAKHPIDFMQSRGFLF